MINDIKQSNLAFFIVALLLLGCTRTEYHKEFRERKPYCLNETIRERITLEEVKIKRVEEVIPLTGSVETAPGKVVHFTSLVSGVVSATFFSPGDYVTKGQTLAELRSTELISLQAELSILESQIEMTENKVNSIKEMFNDGIASRKDLLEIEHELTTLNAEKIRVKSNLSLYSAVPERNVFQIKAPIDGIVTGKNIAAGATVSPDSQALFTISDLSKVWVIVNVYAEKISTVRAGMPVEIATLSYPGEIFNGLISNVSHVFDSESKVLKARVVLENKDLKLKPGMFVDVRALNVKDIEAVSIPAKTLVFDNNENFVVVYNNDCDIEVRKVEVLTGNSQNVFLSKGLKENEVVISTNQLLVYEQIKNFQN